MQKANRITDRFIYGILAALLFYMVIFVYLNVNTVKRSYVFESYFDNPALDISKEELKEYEVTVKSENILVPDDYHSEDVKNISRDMIEMKIGQRINLQSEVKNQLKISKSNFLRKLEEINLDINQVQFRIPKIILSQIKIIPKKNLLRGEIKFMLEV